MKILVVEDDNLLQKGLLKGITNEGYACEIAGTGQEATQLVDYTQYSLIVLDLGLPDCDGLQLLQQWRKNKIQTPILILTARDTIEDRVEGLDFGADDYLVKPFALSELLARIRALIRRDQGATDNILLIGNLKINLKNQQVWQNDNEIFLTPKEFAILSRLALKSGEKVHRDVLQNDLYDWQSDPNSNVLEVYMHSLRQKIGKQYIQTIRGYGYRLTFE
ncbi:two-component system response regulator PmrA [Zophobihabitans entericus]|uniref:Two-component system response regulator PmrA n=1 Tax=Zophobihabitans entericus TaxID=1635327 RepID=A0A6G9IEB7_9GAMM|nr:two-component system response regulator PmrA [Zophobihabitans entericus]QIQ21930.1 two-component system response regulator PmrA [Zophobihabitans entericus]